MRALSGDDSELLSKTTPRRVDHGDSAKLTSQLLAAKVRFLNLRA